MEIWYYDESGRLCNYQCKSLPVIIGRGSVCGLSIPDPSVSLKHASLSSINSMAILTDLDSTNGTLVNNIRISKHTLSDGDSVQLGRFNCWYSSEGKPNSLPNFISTQAGGIPYTLFQHKNTPKSAESANTLRKNLIQEFMENIEKFFPRILDNLLVRILPWPESAVSPAAESNLVQKSITCGGPCLQIKKDNNKEIEFMHLSTALKNRLTLPKVRSFKGVKHLAIAYPIKTRAVQAVFYLESYSPESQSDRLFQALEIFMAALHFFEASSPHKAKNLLKDAIDGKAHKKKLPFL